MTDEMKRIKELMEDKESGGKFIETDNYYIAISEPTGIFEPKNRERRKAGGFGLENGKLVDWDIFKGMPEEVIHALQKENYDIAYIEGNFM